MNSAANRRGSEVRDICGNDRGRVGGSDGPILGDAVIAVKLLARPDEVVAGAFPYRHHPGDCARIHQSDGGTMGGTAVHRPLLAPPIGEALDEDALAIGPGLMAWMAIRELEIS